ncbi:TPA: 3-deoxy-manno-octulosonate cytidylyltransferase [Campylobacter jejuni]
MKIIGVIPARYGSTRFPGKPLADILGKPMIWWVYQQAKQVNDFSEIYVALDSDYVAEVCDKYHIPFIFTSKNHSTHIDRIHEVSDKIPADYYVAICGDEPLIDANAIRLVLPEAREKKPIVYALKRKFFDPCEVIDPNNIKIITNDKNKCICLSRSPIPFPFKTILFNYYKIVGVECYNKSALDLFVSSSIGSLEKIEDITLLRFLERDVEMLFFEVDTPALSVDTSKDLEKILEILELKIKSNELKHIKGLL